MFDFCLRSFSKVKIKHGKSGQDQPGDGFASDDGAL